MTDLVPTRKGKPTQVSLADLQDKLDARRQISETRSGTSTRKARVEDAKRVFDVDPLKTLEEIERRATLLSEVFDRTINQDAVPLNQRQVNRLSYELYQLEKLKVEIEALETRYKSLVYAHLDSTVKKVPGRPLSQTPGKVVAEGPGPHYILERRGGNRGNPSLNTESLREVLPADVAVQIYKTVHHDAVPARDEEVFDEGRFAELVELGVIDLDVVQEHLIPGEWRTPSFYKTLVEGE